MLLGASGFRRVHDVEVFERLRHVLGMGQLDGESQEGIDIVTITAYRLITLLNDEQATRRRR